MLHVAAVWVFLIIAVLFSCDSNNLPNRGPFQLAPPTATKIVVAADIHTLFESQHSILDSLSFDFNQDGHPDYVFLLKHTSEKQLKHDTKAPKRIVVMIESIMDGRLRLTERNHRILYPLHYHQKEKDSYVGINKSGRFFQIIQSWTDQLLYKRLITFEYNKSHKRWFLYNDRLESYPTNQANQPKILQKTNQGTAFSSFDIFQE